MVEKKVPGYSRPVGQVARLVHASLCLLAMAAAPSTLAVTVGNGDSCVLDPECFNRVHPEVPMVAVADPGELITFQVLNSSGVKLGPEPTSGPGSLVHPIAGPVAIRGAKRGDVLAVTILDVEPVGYGQTEVFPPLGFASDMDFEPFVVVWELASDYATATALPGIRIPNRAFPGIVMTLPDHTAHAAVIAREAALLEVGGNIDPPDPENASPEALCGRSSSKAQACLRTIPPREHGGNMDIRYLAAGSTIYLPCNIDGCGLGIGDTHYAQGDGEVSVTAIEMDARVTVRTAIVKDKVLRRGPHFAGPARLLDIPSRAFYATTGFPIKAEGFVPPWMRYLNADERIATGIYKHLLMAVSSVSPPKLSVGFPRFCRHHLSKSALCRHHQIHWSYYLHMFPKVVSRR